MAESSPHSSKRWRKVTREAPPRASTSEPPRRRGSVAGRLAALEQRVEKLERQLTSQKPQPAAPEATSPAEEPRPSPRCPGCYLQVASTARGRCPWCGFVFDALAGMRRSARRRGGG